MEDLGDQQLRSDVDAIRYYDSLRIDLAGTSLAPVLSRLWQPSLVVLGHDAALVPDWSTRVVAELAHRGLGQSRRVTVTSGRAWTERLRVESLVGDSATRRLASEQRPEVAKCDTSCRCVPAAEAKRPLEVHGANDDLASAISAALRLRPVGVWLVDDVAAVAHALDGATPRDRTVRFEPSPMGLRALSRSLMCAVVATVDWRLSEGWRWQREADTVIEVVPESEGSGFPGVLAASRWHPLPV